MAAFNLTKRMLEVMAQMQAATDREDYENAEIVRDNCVRGNGGCWLGEMRISPRTVNSLLSLVALRETNDGGQCSRYTLNEVGRALLRRPALRDEIIASLLQGGSWTVENDKMVRI